MQAVNQSSLLPSDRFKVELLPSQSVIENAFQGNLEDCEKTNFFERFLDDRDFTLLRKNYWLRERFYEREDNPHELTLSLVTDTPHSDSMNLLVCQQWKTKVDIEEQLKKSVQREIRDLKWVVAGYNVFRYFLTPGCTIDQAIFDCDNPASRHETLSIRFSSKEKLFEFSNVYGNDTIPTCSKMMACVREENPEALGILCSLGRATEMPKHDQPLCPEPDLSLLEDFVD